MHKTNIVAHPLKLLIWLELPYFVGVSYESELTLRLSPREHLAARLRLQNDLLKIETWNPWAYPIPHDAQFKGWGENWIDPGRTGFQFVPMYCSESESQSWTERLREAGAPYIHLQRTQTIVVVEADIDGRLPVDNRDKLHDLLPFPSIFERDILPHLAGLIDRYRIATIPRLRYALHPVTEAVVSEAVVELRMPTGEVIRQVGYGFDPRSELKGFHYLAERAGVQERFDVLVQSEDLGPEATITVVYNLLHMRRWTEALVIAASVVDDLLKEAVSASAPSPEIAALIWGSYRTRHEDLFKQVLPALGLAHLPSTDKSLWEAYRAARTARGSAAHGDRLSVYDEQMQHDTKRHANAFARTARWLSLQMSRSWALDIPGADGDLLPEFD